MNTGSVTELRLGSQRYEFRHQGQRTTLTFDHRYLTKEWKRSVAKGKSTYLLHRLSPNIVEETIINGEALRMVRVAWVLLVAAIVVFFSEYNSKIPLLTPVLIIFGVSLMAVNVKKSWPRNWALVYDDYNYKQVAILVPDEEEDYKGSERQKFIDSLSGAIEDAKKKEFYDA